MDACSYCQKALEHQRFELSIKFKAECVDSVGGTQITVACRAIVSK